MSRASWIAIGTCIIAGVLNACSSTVISRAETRPDAQDASAAGGGAARGTGGTGGTSHLGGAGTGAPGAQRGDGGACQGMTAPGEPGVVRADGGVDSPATPRPCVWRFPAPPSGAVRSDYDVNLQLSAPGVEPLPIGHVASRAACAPDGWYFDDASPPSQILLCPSTCAMVQASKDGVVDLVFGCPTLPVP